MTNRLPRYWFALQGITGYAHAGLWLLAALTLSAAAPVRAADPTAYRVTLAPTGDDALDSTLAATSDLVSLRKSSPVGAFGLIVRARTDADRLKTVLESFGYYRSKVSITIDGTPLANPRLADALSARPKGHELQVSVAFDLGPLYRLRRIDIDGALPPEVHGALGLAAGAPAAAGQVLAGGARLHAALQEHGYAFARVDPPIAYEGRSQPVLDLRFHVVAGPRVKFGAIHVVGLQRIHESLVRRRLTLHTGQLYSTSAIEEARRELLDLGVFAAVSVRLGAAPDARGEVPVTFTVRERPRHAVSINAAYSSDLGGSGGVTWSDRNVFGNAEQLNIAASATNFGGSATTGLGYDTSAKLLIPDVGHRDQSLQFALGAIKQSLQAYQQTAVTSGVVLHRKLSTIWSINVGLTSAHETIVQDGVTYHYTLIATPVGVDYDTTNLSSPLDDPLHGLRGSVSITPTRSIGSTSATFLINQFKLAGYVDLHDFGFAAPGRSVLAARALAGLARGAGEFSLPPDQRFYGGGSGTIRGYRYQSVGPQLDGKPLGGTAIIAGSLEFRQRFGEHFGAAVFVDGGQVSASSKALPNVFQVGVGAGIRYYTPIGPIRVDVAVPTTRYSGNPDAFEIYIGLGQAF